jgi:UPF0755 protein
MNFLRTLKSRISLLAQKLNSYEIIVNVRGKANTVHPVLDVHFFKIISSIVLVFFVSFSLYFLAWQAPENFPSHSIFTINKGERLSDVAKELKSQGLIRYSSWLEFLVILQGGDKKVIAGDYYVENPLNVLALSDIILKGEFGLTPIKVSIPEGLNSVEIAKLLSLSLPKFDTTKFVQEAKSNEGYLFPDTYFLTPNAKPDDIISLMRENFTRKTESLGEDVYKFGKPWGDVVIVASIVEDEAKSISDKRLIAGIIWKRLKMKMPLQVDSTLRYTTGRGSNDLTKEDLTADDPYNTYKNKGLPPTPISNPGLDSIRAALAPTNSKYLYFLSDKNGEMHYASTFEQHKANREEYLN